MEESTRIDGRGVGTLRPIYFERAVSRYAEGSALVRWGNTHVLCTASVDEKVPPFMRASGSGWITAEYAMLPRATHQRSPRDISRGKQNARGSEIQRLIGRSLRAAVDMPKLGERTITIDCDVLQADGGTRTASITGAHVALVDALNWAKQNGKIKSVKNVLLDSVSAVSVGVIDGEPMLDLPYVEDSRAMTDMNVAMTGSGKFVEIQGTAEHRPFSRNELGVLLDLATKGNRELQAAQQAALDADLR